MPLRETGRFCRACCPCCKECARTGIVPNIAEHIRDAWIDGNKGERLSK